MGLFTTHQLLGYTKQKVESRALFLEPFSRRMMNFHTEGVMLDKIIGKIPVTAYVSPIIEGKVLHHHGGETRVLRPGCVRPKHGFNYQQAVECLPGEDLAQLNGPAYRRLRITTDSLKQKEHAIVQVEEMQVVNAVLYGKYTMEGDQFDTVEMDLGYSEGNNIEQTDGKKWSEQDRDTFDPTYDIDLYCDRTSGLANIAVMDDAVRRLLNGFKLFHEGLDTRRGLNSQLETAVKDLGAVASFKGYYGDLAIVVAKTSYVAEDGTEKCYLSEDILVLGNTAAEGIRRCGTVKDAQALSEGVVASSRYLKHRLTVGDPSCEFIMVQFAPLTVLPDPGELMVVQVKQFMDGDEMPLCLSSQKAEMATREENLDRLRRSTDLLGREADMSRNAVDIAQCVSEWEEELAVSPEDIVHFDESGADQNHIGGGEQLNNIDIPDDVKAVRAQKCLQVMGYRPETGRPAKLALRGMCVLVPSSLAAAIIRHGTTEYAWFSECL